MKPCPSDTQLGAFLDGELPEAEAAAIEAHVATCERCAAEVAAYARLDKLVATAPVPEVADDEWAAAWSTIAARIAPEPAQTSTLWSRLGRLRTALVPAAAAALIALAAGVWALHSGRVLVPVQAVVEEIEPAEGYTANCFYSAEADVTIITVLPTDGQEEAWDDNGQGPL